MQMYYLISLDLHPLQFQVMDPLESDSRSLATRCQRFSLLGRISLGPKRGLRTSLVSQPCIVIHVLHVHFSYCTQYCTSHQDCTACTEDMQTQIYIPPKVVHFVVGSFLHFCIGACHELRTMYYVLRSHCATRPFKARQ